MTSFLFCLIFVQVSIFFIVGFLLLALFYMGMKQGNLAPARGTNRMRIRQRRG